MKLHAWEKLKSIGSGDNYIRLFTDSELDLSDNYFTEIPSDIKYFRKLTYIDLSNNNFKDFPKPIFELKQLIHLNISNNLIETIPKPISKLINLKFLNISFNKLRFISKKNVKLKNLKSFDMSDNYLGKIPECVREMNNLETLCVGYNRNIKEMPGFLFNMPNLKTIEMSGTLLKRIRCDFCDKIVLNKIYLCILFTQLDFINEYHYKGAYYECRSSIWNFLLCVGKKRTKSYPYFVGSKLFDKNLIKLIVDFF